MTPDLDECLKVLLNREIYRCGMMCKGKMERLWMFGLIPTPPFVALFPICDMQGLRAKLFHVTDNYSFMLNGNWANISC